MYKNSTVVPQTEQTTNPKAEAQGPKQGGDCTWTLLPCHTRGNCTSVIRPACALAVHRNTVRQENNCKWGKLCPIRSRRSAESPLHSRRQSHRQCTREVALSPNSIAASDLLAIVASARAHVRRDGRSRRCDGRRQLERCRRGESPHCGREIPATIRSEGCDRQKNTILPAQTTEYAKPQPQRHTAKEPGGKE